MTTSAHSDGIVLGQCLPMISCYYVSAGRRQLHTVEFIVGVACHVTKLNGESLKFLLLLLMLMVLLLLLLLLLVLLLVLLLLPLPLLLLLLLLSDRPPTTPLRRASQHPLL